MKVVLLPEINISVVRVDNGYHVKVELETKNYIHGYAFESLKDAVEFASKILEVKRIDLQYWEKKSSLSNVWDQFLIRNCNKVTDNQKAHLWSGLDTLCRMWSTGGLGYDYDLFNTNFDRRICTMCLNKSRNKSVGITESYLQTRANRGERSKYEAVLSKVPDVETETNI